MKGLWQFLKMFAPKLSAAERARLIRDDAYPSYYIPSAAASYKRNSRERPLEGEIYWQNSLGQVSRIRMGSAFENNVLNDHRSACAWDRTVGGFVYYMKPRRERRRRWPAPDLHLDYLVQRTLDSLGAE